MKRKHTHFNNNNQNYFKEKQYYQLEEDWEKRKKECEKMLSKFC